MSAALQHDPTPHRRLTVAEFLHWAAATGSAERWQLRDGTLEMMAPASVPHGAIQSEFARLLGNHLLAQRGGACRVLTNPGVVPRARSNHTMLIPDLAVECGPPTTDHALREPLVLIEIMSPSNENQTRANLWAFMSIPSVMEIVTVGSVIMGAELFRRRPDGSWPEGPETVAADGRLSIEAIGFALPLVELYRTTTLG